jgi:hypothetical protein
MLAHEIFDLETNKRVLVDHAFIVSGGRDHKAVRNWLGNALDASKRSQIMFMDRDDILNLYVVANLPQPSEALPGCRSASGERGDQADPVGRRSRSIRCLTRRPHADSPRGRAIVSACSPALASCP